MKVKVQPEEEIKYQIESDYGWLECTYYPNRAIEHFSNLFSHYAQHMVEPDVIDNAASYSLYMNHATDLLGQFAKQELERALKNLVLKIEIQTLIAVDNIKPKEATKRINQIADSIKKEVKRDMNAPKRGGARKERGRTYFTSNEELAEYARTVNGLRPLWTFITDYFKRNGYGLTVRTQIKKDPTFQALSQFCSDVPDKLLDKARRRENLFQIDKKSKLELYPSGLALEHARLELDIGHYSIETLKKRFNEGNKALKKKQL